MQSATAIKLKTEKKTQTKKYKKAKTNMEQDTAETIDKISKQDDNTLISYGSSIRSSKRRAHNGSSSPRKCSFKTHAKNTYVPRKMVGSSSSSGGRVAALTEKFNKIIEKDVNFLNEVKRNNGVLLSKAGHVYKIKEAVVIVPPPAAAVTTPAPAQIQQSPLIEKNNASPEHGTNNSVRETIKIFENLKPSDTAQRHSFTLDLALNDCSQLEKIDEVLTPVKDDCLLADEMHFDDETDKRILEAIDLVENKIAFLSKEELVSEPVLKPPKPNESFLHSTKIVSNSNDNCDDDDDVGISLIEAVNSSLIGGKQQQHRNLDENPLNNGYSPIIYKEICNTYEYIKTSADQVVKDTVDDISVTLVTCTTNNDGYEVCENKEKISQRTTTDELPPLPEPKRKPSTQEVARELPKIPSNCDDLYDLSEAGEVEEDEEEEENIYATIRGYDGDNMSVISHNGYESIGGYNKIKKSPSVSTISSDLKANSLYGVSMVSMDPTVNICKSVPVITINDANKTTATCNGEIEINDSDDDEWVEISDPDDNTSEARNKFVV